jgi:hypothetical protein
LLQDPFDRKLLDIVIFDVSLYTDRNGEHQHQITLAKEIKERNPLHFGFEALPFLCMILFCLIGISCQSTKFHINNGIPFCTIFCTVFSFLYLLIYYHSGGFPYYIFPKKTMRFLCTSRIAWIPKWPLNSKLPRLTC